MISATKVAVPIRPKEGLQRPALRLVKTTSLDRDQWLEVRKGGIGSSDAASAVGLHPYKSQLQLWMEKTGRDGGLPVVDPNDDQSPMYWGTLLEPIVAAHYTKRTGHRVRRVNAVLQHPEHPWMRANLDREVVGAPDVQILECKTAGIHGSRLWREGVPEYVQLQVMHQLAVTGKQAADVAVLLGGQTLEIHRIERDEQMIARLARRGQPDVVTVHRLMCPGTADEAVAAGEADGQAMLGAQHLVQRHEPGQGTGERHGDHDLAGGRRLAASYHCSRYNMNTRRLTLAMLDAVLMELRRFLDAA